MSHIQTLPSLGSSNQLEIWNVYQHVVKLIEMQRLAKLTFE